jgi:hypothetical protein
MEVGFLEKQCHLVGGNIDIRLAGTLSAGTVLIATSAMWITNFLHGVI